MNPNDPCDTCAFGTRGRGGAADELNNRLKGILCAISGTPFFCHHAADGTIYNWQAGKLGPMALAPNNRRLCAGWKHAVAKLAARGHFRFSPVDAEQHLLRQYHKGLGNDATRALDDFLATREPVAKAEANRRLKMNVQALKTEGLHEIFD